MTDRRSGSVGLTADLRRTGVITNRQTGMLGLRVDLLPLAHSASESGFVGLQVDLARTGIIVNRQTGSVFLNVDYGASVVATNAARWSGTAFELGTSSPLVYWSGTAFGSNGIKPVLWVTDHFEVSP